MRKSDVKGRSEWRTCPVCDRACYVRPGLLKRWRACSVECSAKLRRRCQPWNKLQERLFERADADNTTVSKLVREAGLVPGTINDWIAGVGRAVHADLVRSLADLLDLPHEQAVAEADGRVITPPPTCRGKDGTCGRTAARGSFQFLARLESYDPTTHTYLCTPCRFAACTIEITCGRCSATRSMLLGEAKRMKSFKKRGGRYFCLCAPCASHSAARNAVERHLQEMHGYHPSADPEARKEAFRAHQRDCIFPKVVAGTDEESGQDLLIRLMLAGREGGSSEQARQRRSLKLIAAGAKRRGEFRLCPGCQKLIYLAPHRIRDRAPGFHANCYRVYQGGELYQEWVKGWKALRGRRRQQWLRDHPQPLPKRMRARPFDPALFDLRFRWLLRQTVLRESLTEIAATSLPNPPGFSPSVILEGIQTFVGLLPDSWTEVFTLRPQQGALLDAMLPIDQLRRAKRSPGAHAS